MIQAILISRVFAFSVGVICTTGVVMAMPPVPSPIPLEKGTRWIYEGEIKTALAGSSTVYSTNITWVMEIIDSSKSTNALAAVVSGFPDELPWYEPGQTPGFCVLLNFRNRVYQFKAKDEKEAQSILQQVINQPGKFSAAAEGFNELLALPLAKDSRWGGDTNREDGWYCWRVEKAQTAKLQIKGCSEGTAFKVYTLAYRTNPDHQILDVATGLGISRYVFVHHGTVAEVDVHLVSFKSPL